MTMTLDQEKTLAVALASEIVSAGLVLCAPYVMGHRTAGVGTFVQGRSVTVLYDVISSANGLCFAFIEACASTVSEARALAVAWARDNVPYPHAVRQSS